jgi:hypothetical protein
MKETQEKDIGNSLEEIVNIESNSLLSPAPEKPHGNENVASDANSKELSFNEKIINEEFMEKINNKYDERICYFCKSIKRHSLPHFQQCHDDILRALNKARQQGRDEERKKIIDEIENWLIEIDSITRKKILDQLRNQEAK